MLFGDDLIAFGDAHRPGKFTALLDSFPNALK